MNNAKPLKKTYSTSTAKATLPKTMGTQKNSAATKSHFYPRQAAQQSSFTLQSSQSQSSLACASASRLGDSRAAYLMNSASRRGSQFTGANVKLKSMNTMHTPAKHAMHQSSYRTPFGQVARASQMTVDQRSTAITSGLASPSMHFYQHKSSTHSRPGVPSASDKLRSSVHSATVAQRMPASRIAPKKTKTSAYLARCQATNSNANFWGELTKMAEKAHKVNQIDAKLNPNAATGPQVSVDMTAKHPRASSSNSRGVGGIRTMNGDRTYAIGGTDKPEHVLAGNAMNEIMHMEQKGRRALTPAADPYTRSSA